MNFRIALGLYPRNVKLSLTGYDVAWFMSSSHKQDISNNVIFALKMS